jgi:SNF2 family DNA or RNA helicase
MEGFFRMYVKTVPMGHQKEALLRMKGRNFFALLMEQGTGKTLVLLAHSMMEYAAGRLDGALVCAPNSVQINWVTQEIPKHIPEYTDVRAAYYSAKMGVKAERELEKKLFNPRVNGAQPPFRLLAINFEALTSAKGMKLATRFLNSLARPAIIVDESHRIKNSRAALTKALMKLAPLSVQRYIASGTPILNSPIDAFAQFQFLSRGCLGFDKLTSFRAEYCELLPEGHGLLRHIAQRTGGKYAPQIVAKNKDGEPIYRNQAKLAKSIEQHSYRVLKSDCLDLPDKIYKTAPFHLSQAQRKTYNWIRSELNFKMDKEAAYFSPMTAVLKLQQITSNYIQMQNRIEIIGPENPRLNTLLELLEDIDSPKVIIWARFLPEIDQIAGALIGECEVLNGSVPSEERMKIVDRFEKGDLRYLIAQPQTGGTGITLIAADTVIYYSNDYSLGNRLQTEDRAHRIGQTKTVTYIDLLAIDTHDEKIIQALQRKQLVSEKLLGDAIRV